MDIFLETIGPAAIAILAVLSVFGVFYLLKADPIYLLSIHVISRIVLDSYPEYTYLKSFSGLSLMQLYSVGITAIGLVYLFLRGRLSLHGYTAPLLAIVFSYAVSAVIHGTWMEFATAALRWIYLWLMIALTSFALSCGGDRKLMFSICAAGLYAFANQMYSVVTGAPKWGAGMWTYVGTYFHESDICFIFVMFATGGLYFLTCSRITKDRLIGMGCFGAACIGLYLAAYRSLWLAFAAYMIVYFLNRYQRSDITRRTAWIAGSAVGLVAIVATVGPEILDKMDDLVSFVAAPQEYLDFSGNAETVGLMSGRVDLINSYMGIYLNSGVHVLLGGIGPDQGSIEIGLYAHNEYLSALVETGIIGFLALMWFLLRFTRQSLSLAKEASAAAQVACPFFMIALVSGLGTMPFRDMRAMMAIGIMIGIVEWYSKQRRLRANHLHQNLMIDREVQLLS